MQLNRSTVERWTVCRALSTHTVSFLTVWVLLTSQAVFSQQPQMLATDPNRVFVLGVADAFDGVRAAIEKAKQESGRDYRSIIVQSAGEQTDAPTRMLDSVIDRWREESAGAKDTTDQSSVFDPARDVTILLDVTNKKLAMRVPWSMELASGLDPQTLKAELIDKVFVPRAKDEQYDEGLADLIDATEVWVKTKTNQTQARIEAARVFRTRTLPIGLSALLALSGLCAFFLLRSRHDQRMHAARTKLVQFKAEVVALSDLLDSQQERHRMLLHADPDFQTPMHGLTRSAYDNVQSAIGRYRERWLTLMDIWEKAEVRIDSEWFLGTATADSAINLLASTAASPPLAEVTGECRTPLDMLEKAHEKARELSIESAASIAATTQRLDAFALRGRSQAVFAGVMAEMNRGLGLAQQDLESDPVAARGRLDGMLSTLSRTVDQIESFEAVDDRREKVRLQADEIEKHVGVKRAEGWLLHELGANPDALIAAVRKAAALAADVLDSGETAVAQGHVERAEQTAAEAHALLAGIVAARTKVDELLPGCRERFELLSTQRAAAVDSIAGMRALYADCSWSDVATNIGKADAGLARVGELILAAQAASNLAEQHYLRAVAIVEETMRQEDWIAACCAAIADRQAQLDRLKISLPQRSNAVRNRVAKITEQFKQQRTDRVRANERSQEAVRLLELAEQGLRLPLPDLLHVMQSLEAADTSAARAEDLGTEDDRLARQAAEDLKETENLMRRATAWYAEGVSADVQRAAAMLQEAQSLLARQRYEDSIKSSAEATRMARDAYAAATAEADRRRCQRQQEIQQRQMQESFARLSRGLGPWVIQLPSGSLRGPDPWRSMQAPRPLQQTPSAPRTATGDWSSRTVQSEW